MAHGRVGDDGVDARVGNIECVDVADPELDAVTDPFLSGQATRHVDQHRTLLDADHAALEAVAAGQARASTTPVPQPSSSTSAVRSSAILST